MVQEMLLEAVDEGTADDAAEDVVGGAAGLLLLKMLVELVRCSCC